MRKLQEEKLGRSEGHRKRIQRTSKYQRLEIPAPPLYALMLSGSMHFKRHVALLAYFSCHINTSAPRVRAAAAAIRARSMPRGLPETTLTRIGPRICPIANAAVSAAIRPAALVGATRRASCIPAMVATMKVLPTQSADSMMPPMPAHATETPTPNARMKCAAIQRARYVRREESQPAANAEITAAAPNIGQAQPNIPGSEITSLAIAGRNVAGMM